MKVQELEQYKEQCRNNQEEVKALKAKVHNNCKNNYNN